MAKAGIIWLTFVNVSARDVSTVRFTISVAGINKATAYFNGHYAPQVPISERLVEKSAAPITDPDAVACAVTFVGFSDGSTWRPAQGSQIIVPQPESPIALQSCSIENIAAATSSNSAPGYNLLLLSSFTNSSQRVATAVRIRFDLFDAFDTKVASVHGTVSGKFNPSALIQPAQNASGYIYTPSSPAWRYYVGPGSADFARGVGPNDLAQTKCWVEDVRFEDGSIWRTKIP